ncbi:MAG: ABC transporter permease subunit [Bradyrhizobiaceae bacterium]|nr:ABC transporter permease subunit [Bradyrhizobiaceae bacterium]
MSATPRWRPLHAFTGGAAGVLLVVAAWEAAAGHLNPLILPSPRAVLADVITLLSDHTNWFVIEATARRALAGFFGGAVVGLACGLLAGTNRAVDKLVDPLMTLLMAMPPIAWVVLALIWFGIGSSSAVFTVAVAVLPIVAVAARAGLLARDRSLDRMAETFGAGLAIRLFDIRLPQIVSHVAPAAIAALAIAMKVAVMIELLALADGLGAALARARVNLDSTRAFAWIAIVLALVLILDRGLLRPLHRRLEQWRDAGHAPPQPGAMA